MRNTEFWLRIFLLLAVLLGGLIEWSVVELNKPGAAAYHSAIVGIGLVVLAIVLIFALMIWRAGRVARRARRPDQRVAEWTLSPETWRAFVDTDLKRQAETPGYEKVWKPRAKSAGGPVIAAKSGILIDGLILGVEPRGINRVTGLGWLQTVPECLEFSSVVTYSTGSSLRTFPALFRVPVEPTAREAAIAAYHYYHDLIQRGELSDPIGHRTMVRAATVLAIFAAPLGALGFWMSFSGVMPNSLIPPLLAFVGGGIAVGAAFVALVVWWAMLKK